MVQLEMAINCRIDDVCETKKGKDDAWIKINKYKYWMNEWMENI